MLASETLSMAGEAHARGEIRSSARRSPPVGAPRGEARFDPLALLEELRLSECGWAAEEPGLRAELSRASIHQLDLAVADSLAQLTGSLRIRYVIRESSPKEAVPSGCGTSQLWTSSRR